MRFTDEDFQELARRMNRMEAGLADHGRWQANHDGRINVLWEQQAQFNSRIENRLDSQSVRMTAIERRVFYISGIAAGLGAALGALLPTFFRAIGGAG